MTHELRNFLPEADPHEILSVQHRKTLSPQAVKLFTAVWYKLRNSGQKTFWMGNAEASRRSRTLIEFIPSAQSELQRAGLVHLVPGENQVKYELLTTEAAQ